MRKLLLTLILILVATGAQAQLRVSDVLLTDEGTLFTIDRVTTADLELETGTAVETTSTSVLRLRVQHADSTETIIVPGSLNGGSHIEPTLAWDDADHRLYIFWQRMPGIGSSELLFASYKEGVWSGVETFDGGNWRIRFNLKVTLTRYAETRTDDGTTTTHPALIAHAIWWEQWGDHESARYAMLELERGNVRSVKTYDLTDFQTHAGAPYELPADYDKGVFRTAFIFDMPDADSVDVMFANWYTNHYQLVNIRPVLDDKNGVLHIPIGVTRDEFEPTPIHMPDVNSALKAIRPNTATGTVVMYSESGDTLSYAEMRRGKWSSAREIKLRDTTTLETALEALRKRAAQR